MHENQIAGPTTLWGCRSHCPFSCQNMWASCLLRVTHEMYSGPHAKLSKLCISYAFVVVAPHATEAIFMQSVPRHTKELDMAEGDCELRACKATASC